MMRKASKAPYVFIAPYVLFFCVFSIFPIMYGFFISLNTWNGLTPPVFSGFENYLTVARDPRFWMALKNTLIFMAMIIPFQIVLGFLVANVLNSRLVKGRAFFRTLYFLPYLTTAIAIGVIFSHLFERNFGLINRLLVASGLMQKGINWTGDVLWSRIMVSFVTVWRYTGYTSVIFMAGLMNINPDLYEAAEIDGANAFQRMMKITLPTKSNRCCCPCSGIRGSMACAPRSPGGVLYHMDDSCQFWVDSLYMLPPALISGGHVDQAILQADGYIKALWDEDKGLFHHIWDEQNQVFINSAYWAVGNGWAISGLTRLIEALPQSKALERERYIGIVRKTIEASLSLAHGDLFHNFLDQPDTFVEVNFAQMLCYTIAKGAKQGWLPEELMDRARKIRETIHAHVSRYGLVQDVCGAPSFDRPGIAPASPRKRRRSSS